MIHLQILSLIIIYYYLIYGILNYHYLSDIYLIILLFFMIKLIINYRKCTLSYLECKLLNKKKEDGYLNKFFDLMIDLRYTNHIYLILSIGMIILYLNSNKFELMLKKISN